MDEAACDRQAAHQVAHGQANLFVDEGDGHLQAQGKAWDMWLAPQSRWRVAHVAARVRLATWALAWKSSSRENSASCLRRAASSMRPAACAACRQQEVAQRAHAEVPLRQTDITGHGRNITPTLPSPVIAVAPS